MSLLHVLLSGVTLPVFEHYQEGGDSKYKTSILYLTCTYGCFMLIQKRLSCLADKSVYIIGIGVLTSSMVFALFLWYREIIRDNSGFWFPKSVSNSDEEEACLELPDFQTGRSHCGHAQQWSIVT